MLHHFVQRMSKELFLFGTPIILCMSKSYLAHHIIFTLNVANFLEIFSLSTVSHHTSHVTFTLRVIKTHWHLRFMKTYTKTSKNRDWSIHECWYKIITFINIFLPDRSPIRMFETGSIITISPLTDLQQVTIWVSLTSPEWSRPGLPGVAHVLKTFVVFLP